MSNFQTTGGTNMEFLCLRHVVCLILLMTIAYFLGGVNRIMTGDGSRQRKRSPHHINANADLHNVNANTAHISHQRTDPETFHN